MTPQRFDLAEAAYVEMIAKGFHPDFTPQVEQQVAALRQPESDQRDGAVRDMRDLLWSSIDNDTSRDLDQVEFAEPVEGGIRVMVGIADVDSDVPPGSPVDRHAASEATTVYTGIRTFPMLPESLSTDVTSLLEDRDRLAVLVEFVVAPDGAIASSAVSRALVRNKAQLTYNGVGPWLEGKAGAPKKVANSEELQAQLKLQDEAARALRERRHQLGALNFERTETQAVVSGGKVQALEIQRRNPASALIEDFMIAANEVMARTLREAGVASIRRVVKAPARWPRIVELAGQYGETLPDEPDGAALNAFLAKRRSADPDHYADVSLAVLKLLGPGEYVLWRPGDQLDGHFGLATHDYTHSTAPNRRFADLVTQRLIKSVIARQAAHYSDDDLGGYAQNCTDRENAARRVERAMQKRIVAVALAERVGERFSAVVTGVAPKGVFVRISDPPVEGRLTRGEHSLDVGDRVEVTLLSTDPSRGYIDFGRA